MKQKPVGEIGGEVWSRLITWARRNVPVEHEQAVSDTITACVDNLMLVLSKYDGYLIQDDTNRALFGSDESQRTADSQSDTTEYRNGD